MKPTFWDLPPAHVTVPQLSVKIATTCSIQYRATHATINSTQKTSNAVEVARKCYNTYKWEGLCKCIQSNYKGDNVSYGVNSLGLLCHCQCLVNVHQITGSWGQKSIQGIVSVHHVPLSNASTFDLAWTENPTNFSIYCPSSFRGWRKHLQGIVSQSLSAREFRINSDQILFQIVLAKETFGYILLK